MPLKLKGSSSGDVTLDVPAAAGTNTLTLPARTGNIITSADTGTVTQAMLAGNVAGNGPAFSAGSSNGQSVNNLSWTKVQFNSKTFDTASCFDNTTNYRFTPNVAGYYQVNGVVAFNGTTSGHVSGAIYKNGSNVFQGASTPNNNTFGGGTAFCAIIYLNGSTDYIELYANQSSGGALTLQNSTIANVFSAALLRAA